MVINGLTGYVIKQSDPELLYKTLLIMKSDAYSYAEMCKHTLIDYKKRFTDTRMTEQYEKIYKDLICKTSVLD